jgi:predicted small lipoprotein YifL
MQTVKTTFIILACVGLLGACGNKGPLYLPDQSSGTEAAAGQEPASKQESTEDESTQADKKDKKDAKKGRGA